MNTYSPIYMGYDIEGVFFRLGRSVAATKLLPDKDKPKFIEDNKRFYGQVFVHNDGRQFEFGGPPNCCCELICDTIWVALKYLHGIASAKGIKTSMIAGAKMPMREIIAGGDRCLESGCAPDFDATKEGTPIYGVQGYCDIEKVFAGFHVHMNVATHNTKELCLLAKYLDYTAGLVSVAMSGVDKYDAIRRSHGIGTAGRFRPQKYKGTRLGFEYRTPSGFMCCTPAHAAILFRTSRFGYNAYINRFNAIFDACPYEEVQRIINKSESLSARRIVNKIALICSKLTHEILSPFSLYPFHFSAFPYIATTGNRIFNALSEYHPVGIRDEWSLSLEFRKNHYARGAGGWLWKRGELHNEIAISERPKTSVNV